MSNGKRLTKPKKNPPRKKKITRQELLLAALFALPALANFGTEWLKHLG